MQYSNIVGSAFTDDAGNYFTALLILNSDCSGVYGNAYIAKELRSHLERQEFLTRVYVRVILSFFAAVLKRIIVFELRNYSFGSVNIHSLPVQLYISLITLARLPGNHLTLLSPI